MYVYYLIQGSFLNKCYQLYTGARVDACMKSMLLYNLAPFIIFPFYIYIIPGKWHYIECVMTYYMSVYLYHVVSIENLMKVHRICDVEYEAWQKE